MSLKSSIQIIIFILIISIIGSVYYKYFSINKNIVEELKSSEINNKDQIKELEKKILNLELKNNELTNKIENDLNVSEKNLKAKEIEKNVNLVDSKEKTKNIANKKLNKIEKNDEQRNIVKNLVKEVEYNTVDQKGNRFQLLANSAKSNKDNSDILDLVKVNGKIISDTRDTIFIISDFGQYNSLNLNSKFYKNVVINYQDKEINCVNFDINMETNKAIAYNNVIVTDVNSQMKAGIVEFDLETKDIIINPDSTTTDIEVVTN